MIFIKYDYVKSVIGDYDVDELRAYPNNPLASTGCAGRGRRQGCPGAPGLACFAFLAHNRLARSRANEGLFG